MALLASTGHSGLGPLKDLFPELLPALPLIRDDVRLSGVLEGLGSDFDSTVSTRFSFGRAHDTAHGTRRRRSVQILAIAGGEAGQLVRLIVIREHRLGWPGQQGVALTVPEVTSEETCWTSGGGTVKQICFSGNEKKGGSWMAARLSSSTVVFQPKYHPTPRKAGSSALDMQLPSSRLDACPVLDLPIASTGGFPHADVSFNPWRRRQLAVIDQEGQWGVWNVEGRPLQAVRPQMNLYRSGMVSEEACVGSQKQVGLQADGWGTVCWVSNANTIVVCSRREMSVFDLNFDPPTRLSMPDLGFSRAPHWILSIQRSPVDPRHLFLLTSADLIWLEIDPADSDASQADTAGVRKLLSWKHSRDAEDVTLTLNASEVGDISIITITSHLNSLVTVFHLSVAENGTVPVSVSDPYNLPIHKQLSGDDGNHAPSKGSRNNWPVCDVRLIPLSYRIEDQDAEGLKQKPRDTQTVFFQLFLLGKDLRLHSMFHAFPAPTDSPTMNLYRASFPTRRIKFQHSSRKSAARVNRSFIIETGDEESTDPADDSNEPMSWFESRKAAKDHAATGDKQRLIDMENVYTAAFRDGEKGSRMQRAPHGTAMGLGSAIDEIYDVGEAIQKLEDILRRSGEHDEPFVRTLHELHPLTTMFSDVEQASLELGNVLQASLDLDDGDGNPASRPNILRSLGGAMVLGSQSTSSEGGETRGTSASSLAHIYKHLVGGWRDPLPSNVSDDVRASIEREARKVALTLYLASIGANPPRGKRDEGLELAVTEPHQFSLPLRGPPPSSSFPAQSNRASQDLSLAADVPSFQPAHLPSLQTPPTSSLPSAQTLTDTRSGNTADEAFHRLLGLITLTPQPRLPKKLHRLLSEWDPSGDPESYAWRPLSRRSDALSEDQDDDEDDTDGLEGSRPRAEERARARRQRRKRAEREAKKARSKSYATSSDGRGNEPPMISSQPMFSGSQPTLTTGSGTDAASNLVPALASSQADDLAMSQVERGPFGSRLTQGGKKKKVGKGKKRVAGF
ncbi:MAG: hypothetical protein M1817_006135 [Caeruleum heppii]|nr:MAG: hypothetical protein M1817_006135 [Caeruleum heppii]